MVAPLSIINREQIDDGVDAFDEALEVADREVER